MMVYNEQQATRIKNHRAGFVYEEGTGKITPRWQKKIFSNNYPLQVAGYKFQGENTLIRDSPDCPCHLKLVTCNWLLQTINNQEQTTDHILPQRSDRAAH
jgi:hypothetical protein